MFKTTVLNWTLPCKGISGLGYNLNPNENKTTAQSHTSVHVLIISIIMKRIEWSRRRFKLFNPLSWCCLYFLVQEQLEKNRRDHDGTNQVELKKLIKPTFFIVFWSLQKALMPCLKRQFKCLTGLFHLRVFQGQINTTN